MACSGTALLCFTLFIYSYLTTLSISQTVQRLMIGWGWYWIMNWKGCGRKQSWPNLRYYPSICLEGLRKTTKYLRQGSRSPGRDLNLGSPEYEAGVLTIRPWRSYASYNTQGTTHSRSFGLFCIVAIVPLETADRTSTEVASTLLVLGVTVAGVYRRLLYRRCSEPLEHMAAVDRAVWARQTVHIYGARAWVVWTHLKEVCFRVPLVVCTTLFSFCLTVLIGWLIKSVVLQ
jgi:hypothetical protein